MTIDREQIIAAARECGHWSGQTIEMNDVGIERFYSIAFEAGRQAEREDIALSLSPYDSPIKTEIQRMADILAIELVEAIRARSTK